MQTTIILINLFLPANSSRTLTPGSPLPLTGIFLELEGGKQTTKQAPWPLVRKRTIPTE
jgi:hypothetical protein